MTVATLPFETSLRSESEIRRYPTFRQVRVEKPDFTVAYVMAVVLGFVFGLAIAAVYYGTPFNILSPYQAETAQFSAAVYKAPAATEATQPLPLESKADKQEVNASAPLLTVVVRKSLAQLSTSLTHASFTVRTHHSARNASARKRFSARFKNSSRYRTIEFSKTPVTIPKDQAGETATPLVAARPPSFMIEGDATVADYDAQAGMIETQDGRTFTVAKTADENIAIPWTDSLSSVHYRCDQSGNCTLFHAGFAVPNARLSG